MIGVILGKITVSAICLRSCADRALRLESGQENGGMQKNQCLCVLHRVCMQRCELSDIYCNFV